MYSIYSVGLLLIQLVVAITNLGISGPFFLIELKYNFEL